MGEGRWKLAGTVVVGILLGACSAAGTGSPIAGPTTTSASPTTAAVTTTTLDPTDAAILAAYRGSWADYIAVAETYPVKPLDPRLALHDTGKELVGERKALTVLNMLGHYNVGPTDLAPVVTSVSGDTAVVTDCVFDHSYEVDAVTKKPVEQPDIGHSLARAQMSRINGMWYVSDSTVLKSGKTEDACSPGIV